MQFLLFLFITALTFLFLIRHNSSNLVVKIAVAILFLAFAAWAISNVVFFILGLDKAKYR